MPWNGCSALDGVNLNYKSFLLLLTGRLKSPVEETNNSKLKVIWGNMTLDKINQRKVERISKLTDNHKKWLKWCSKNKPFHSIYSAKLSKTKDFCKKLLQNYKTCNFGNLALKWGDNLFSAPSVILRSLVYLIIWSALHSVSGVLNFCVFILCPRKDKKIYSIHSPKLRKVKRPKIYVRTYYSTIKHKAWSVPCTSADELNEGEFFAQSFEWGTRRRVNINWHYETLEILP